MDFKLLLMVWSALLLATVAVSVVRWSASQKEDDHLHFMDNETDLVAVQAATAKRLSSLDRLRRTLLLATVLVGLLLAGFHLYRVWQQGAGIVTY